MLLQSENQNFLTVTSKSKSIYGKKEKINQE